MQWPLLIRKPIAYKPEIDPRHVRTEVGLNQAHLNSCQNSAFLWFGDFVLMLDLAFVCLYQYLFDFSPSTFFLKIFFSMLYMGERYTLPASFLKWNYLSGLKNIDKRKPLSSKARAFLGFRRF